MNATNPEDRAADEGKGGLHVVLPGGDERPELIGRQNEQLSHPKKLASPPSQIPAKSLGRIQKIALISIMLMVVGIFTVQFKTVNSAMICGAVCIAAGTVFCFMAFQEWMSEKGNRLFEKKRIGE